MGERPRGEAALLVVGLVLGLAGLLLELNAYRSPIVRLSAQVGSNLDVWFAMLAGLALALTGAVLAFVWVVRSPRGRVLVAVLAAVLMMAGVAIPLLARQGPVAELAIECDLEMLMGGVQYTDFRQAWPDQRQRCEARVSDRPLTVAERRAVQVADYEEPERVSLASIYALCAESGNGMWDYRGPASAAQKKEAMAILLLCPDHPDAARIRAFTAS